MISTTIYELSEKFMSVKIHVLKRASAAKLYSDICRYFYETLKNGYLLFDSRKHNIVILLLPGAVLIKISKRSYSAEFDFFIKNSGYMSFL